MSQCGFLQLHIIYDPLGFLYLDIHFFLYIWVVSAIVYLNKLSSPLSLSLNSITPILHTLVRLIMCYKCLKLSSLFLFSFCSYDQLIFNDLSLSSPILSFAQSSLLLKPSSESVQLHSLAPRFLLLCEYFLFVEIITLFLHILLTLLNIFMMVILNSL